jgi:uncharacterized membrane protein
MRVITILASLCLTLVATGVALAANRDPLPGAFECFGTEPFWSIKVAPGRARADLMFIDRRYAFAPTSVQQTMNRPDIWLVRGSGRVAKLSLVVRREACSDGMSDNEYPYSAVAAISGLRPIAGCCRPGRYK